MPPPAPLVDPAVQDDIRAAFDGPALAALIATFLAAIRAEASAIQAAERAGDHAAVVEAAHRLVSAASQFGFPELAAVARAIEQGRMTGVEAGLASALARAAEAAAGLAER